MIVAAEPNVEQLASVTQRPTSTHPPLLDEAKFDQLLAAAFVVQEHNDRLQLGKTPENNYARTLIEIIELEQQIRALDWQAGMRLVAERAQELAHANSVLIGLVTDGHLVYRVATGSAEDEAGTRSSLHSVLPAECLRTGKTLQSTNAERDLGLGADLARRRGVKSLIAVPVHQEGKIAGVLEVRFAQTEAFLQEDVRTSELMAGLLAEAIPKNAGRTWKQALADSEEAAVLEAWTSMSPPAKGEAKKRQAHPAESALPRAPENTRARTPEPAAQSSRKGCRICGQQFTGDEAFCGVCGTARAAAYDDSPADSQLKPWPAVNAPEDGDAEVEANENLDPAEANAAIAASPFRWKGKETLPSALEDLVERLSDDPDAEDADDSLAAAADDQMPGADSLESASTWNSSAAHAREWFESQKVQSPLLQFWQLHRAGLYLATATLLLVVVIAGWMMQPAAPLAAAHGSRTPELNLFEKALVAIGLAEAPESPVYAGNPDTRVWVDLRTALYHCPGSDLYGKTRDGKYTRQRSAQQDGFEPSSRKACK
ncbi:MAG TPA: GAF domain-containing protein [Terriglobales bacterium]